MIESFHEKDMKKKKFIIILREPISRQFSWFQFKLRNYISPLVKSRMIKDLKKKDKNWYKLRDICEKVANFSLSEETKILTCEEKIMMVKTGDVGGSWEANYQQLRNFTHGELDYGFYRLARSSHNE